MLNQVGEPVTRYVLRYNSNLFENASENNEFINTIYKI